MRMWGVLLFSPHPMGSRFTGGVFFARLNPHDPFEMSSFFQYLCTYQNEIFKELAQGSENIRESSVSAWERCDSGNSGCHQEG